MVENPEEKISLGRPRYRWVDSTSIKLLLGEIGRDVGGWIGLAQTDTSGGPLSMR
jgi:hypothetical protein